jgi:hypothetical protein
LALFLLEEAQLGGGLLPAEVRVLPPPLLSPVNATMALLTSLSLRGIFSETYSTAGFIFGTSGKYIFEIRDREEIFCPSIPQL